MDWIAVVCRRRRKYATFIFAREFLRFFDFQWFCSRLHASCESRADNFDWSSHLYDAIGYHVLACCGTTVFAEGMYWSNIEGWEVSRRINIFFQNNSKLLRVTCAIASLLFVISDTMIAIDEYYTPINNSTVTLIVSSPLSHLQIPENIFSLVHLQLWIMITYYAAQFGITLSIVELHEMKPREPLVKPLAKTAAKNAWITRMNSILKVFKFGGGYQYQLFLWCKQPDWIKDNSFLLINNKSNDVQMSKCPKTNCETNTWFRFVYDRWRTVFFSPSLSLFFNRWLWQ